jgi:hypothetical protein
MNILSKAAISAAPMAVLALSICLPGCSEKATDPTTEGITAYDFYFVTGNEEYLYYRYNTGTMDLETFTLPYSNREGGFCISPDGNSMYLNTADHIVKISLDSLTVEYEQPISVRGHQLVISPNERYLAFLTPDLYLVDLTDFSIVHADNNDTLAHENGRFSRGGEVFVCAASAFHGGYVLEIDLEDDFAEKWRYFERRWPRWIIPDLDNQKWYLCTESEFLIYDLIGDSVLNSHSVYPGISDMEITPDGHFVIYCQPGSPGQIGPAIPGADHFTIFDCLNNDIEREVEVIATIGHPMTAWRIHELCISPDGGRLVGLNMEYGLMFDYDLKADRFNWLISFHPGFWVGANSLTCQSRP